MIRNSDKNISFEDLVHFIDEENIVTYPDFNCGITFYPKTPTKIRQLNRERNCFSRSYDKPKCLPNNDQHNCFLDEQDNSNIFLNHYSLWDVAQAAFMSPNNTNDRYSISNQYPQPTIHQPRTDSYSVFSSLRTMNSKRKGLRVSFAFFQRKSNGWTSERNNAMAEELSELWKPGAMDRIPSIVMNCNCS